VCNNHSPEKANENSGHHKQEKFFSGKMNFLVLSYILGTVAGILYALASYLRPTHRIYSKRCLVCAIVLTLLAIPAFWYGQEHNSPKEEAQQQPHRQAVAPRDSSAPQSKIPPPTQSSKSSYVAPSRTPEIAGFTFTSDRLFVVVGGNSTEYTRKYLKAGRVIVLQLGSDTIATAHLEGNKLFVDVDLPQKYYDPRVPLKIPLVSVRHNCIQAIPPSWDFNFNETSLEIVNKDQKPVLQVIYKLNNYVTVNCIVEKTLYPQGVRQRIFYCVDKNGIRWPLSTPECNLLHIFKYPYEMHKHETQP
jgi:hypothetical protein